MRSALFLVGLLGVAVAPLLAADTFDITVQTRDGNSLVATTTTSGFILETSLGRVDIKLEDVIQISYELDSLVVVMRDGSRIGGKSSVKSWSVKSKLGVFELAVEDISIILVAGSRRPLPDSRESRTVPEKAAIGAPTGIVFARMVGSKWQICRIDLDGSGFVNLSNHNDWDQTPAVSPDGKRIAFARQNSLINLPPQIHVMDIDGCKIQCLTKTGTKEWEPAWSPDGRRIAFSSARSNLFHQVFVMDSDGTGQAAVGYGWGPTWSPDGRTIAATCNMGTTPHLQIIAYAVDSSKSWNRSINDSREDDPDWSPDGRKIAYVRRGKRARQGGADGNSVNSVMDADGENCHILTPADKWCDSPAWSPDGKRIAFCMKVHGKPTLHHMAADGTEVQALGDGKSEDASPDWIAPRGARFQEGEPIPVAYTGIFSLQALLDFDCLDGAAIESAAGTIVLFGHRNSEDRLIPIAYLDHLATAMECENPGFSLEWTTSSEREVDRALEITNDEIGNRLTDWFDSEGKLNAFGEWWLGQGGADVEVGMTKEDANGRILVALGQAELGRRLELFGRWKNKLNSSDPNFKEYLEEWSREVGIFDQIHALYLRREEGEITLEQQLDGQIPYMLWAIAEMFERDSETFTSRYRSLRSGGMDWDAAFPQVINEIMDPEFQKEWLRGVVDGFHRKLPETVYLPPIYARMVLGVEPCVYPVFVNLPPRSLMARVAFEADVFGKSLENMPELKQKIPKYRTEFERLHGSPGAREFSCQDVRFWFTADGFELNESGDGSAVQFGRTSVRINLEKSIGGNRVEDADVALWAEEMTSLYDDIARECPILHELRECMKVIAIAHWFKKQGVRLSFPQEGRALWNPPAEIPGIIWIAIATHETPNPTLVTADGGVELGKEERWRFHKSSDRISITGADPAASPYETTSRQIQDITNKISKIEVPPWGSTMPHEPGYCGKARVGERAMSYVAFREKELSSRVDAVEFELQISKVRAKAEMLIRYDRILNAMTKERVDAMAELQGLAKDGQDARDGIIEELGQTMWSYGVELNQSRLLDKSWGDNLRIGGEDLQRINSRAMDVKGLIDDLSAVVAGWQEHKHDAEYWSRAVERFNQLAVKAGELSIELKRYPEVFRSQEAAQWASRSTRLQTLLLGAGKILIKAGELWSLSEIASAISDVTSSRLKEQTTITVGYKKCLTEYVAEKRKLEEMSQNK